MSSALSFAAWFHQCRGDRQAVKAHVEENMALATEQGFSPRRAQADFLRGWLLVEQGDPEAGITQMANILLSQQARGVSGRWLAHSAALLGEILTKSGRISEALDVVTKAINMTRQSGGRYYEAELQRVKGESILTHDPADPQQAEACFQDALKVARGQSAKSLELRAAMSMSRLWHRQGKKAQAQKLLGEVYDWFTEGFDTADLKRARIILDELA
jgi:predicted ATPase